ncbi:recombinase family protein [Pontimicrobium aquaticum]|uniref:Recombinase family protein n=1 Tax=Pontimicrobium aquaticum TaxID=2565367 RepID=A0A4U0EVD5_9FLAO|nr:recombinase family protein [Pontimicrobium aquaticum]TJY35886.1 recombinase family protein [Pontimicrobium aquaticum]
MEQLAIYCRKSQDNKDRDSTSINEQENQGKLKAVELDLEPVLFIEDTSSGKLDLKDRPIMMDMLQKISVKDSKIKAVFAYDTSRLYRNDETKHKFLAIIKRKDVELYFKSGRFDWNDPHHKLLHNILSATDEFFVDLTSVKIKDTLRSKARDGKVNGAVLPYGYTKDENSYLKPDESESKIVKKIFDDFIQGKTSSEIRNWLIDNNVQTRYNKIGGTNKVIHKGRNETRVYKKSDSTWTTGTILQIIRNPIYKGKRRWGDEFFDAPIIVDPVKWEKANNSYINRNKGSLRGKNTDHKYLLTPLLQCGCGLSLNGRSNKLENYYGCAGKRYKEKKCTSKYIPVKVLDSIIIQLIYGNLFDTIKVSFSSNNSEKTKELKARIQSLEAELEKINKSKLRIENYSADGTYTKKQYLRQLKRLDDKTNEIIISKSNIEENLILIKGDNNILKEIENLTSIAHSYIKEYPFEDTHPGFMKNYVDSVFKGYLALNLPFLEKQKVIRRFIKNILVKWIPENNLFEITVSYKLPIDDEVYYMDNLTLMLLDANIGQTIWVNTERAKKQRKITVDSKYDFLRDYITNKKNE